MSEAKHTPGPWHFDDRQAGMGDCGSVEALTADRKMVTREVCTVLFDDDDPSEDAANARLIAAAPDLKQACEAIQAALSKYGAQLSDLFGHDEQFNDAVEAVDAAIAKARGQ